MDTKYHLTVKFEGAGFTHAERASLLMAIERLARERTGKPAEVYQPRVEDDLKPRRMMTAEERQKL